MSVLFEPTPDGAERYLDWIVSGLCWTLLLALGAWTIALVIGTLVGVARTLRGGILPRLGRVYVETFRNLSFGSGAAIAYLLALATFAMSYVVIRTVGNRI